MRHQPINFHVPSLRALTRRRPVWWTSAIQELLALEDRMGSVAIAPSAVTVDQLPTHPFSSAQLRRTGGEGGELDEQLTTYVTHRPLNMVIIS